MLLDARFREHDGGKALELFCELFSQDTCRLLKASYA